ncbi:hypothetical protein [Pedobacter psychroterrae]|uniref:DUF4136 domain-containing protein n=1 Tax=Pedobacter psychroterrae TaxID=2530453 RepID=A0A4R0NKQ8_9SPHI|nr:hypothetical protein [Pedobacter psychroterrae]TCD00083.1 hypothetical protein EZ437_15305 [Pedobacter psychroterrae]
MKNRTLIGSLMLTIFMISGCSNTKLLTSWKAPDESATAFKKVLVIALMTDKDRKLRENVENVIVKDLQAHGINAGSALAEYGPKAFDSKDESAAIKTISDRGYDGTFTIALLDKRKEKRHNPGMITYRPVRFWGYYNSMYARVYQPAYQSVSNQFILEGNFYNINPDKLIYSAQTKTVDPSSPLSLATIFSAKLFNDMKSKGLIK